MTDQPGGACTDEAAPARAPCEWAEVMGTGAAWGCGCALEVTARVLAGSVGAAVPAAGAEPCSAGEPPGSALSTVTRTATKSSPTPTKSRSRVAATGSKPYEADRALWVQVAPIAAKKCQMTTSAEGVVPPPAGHV